MPKRVDGKTFPSPPPGWIEIKTLFQGEMVPMLYCSHACVFRAKQHEGEWVPEAVVQRDIYMIGDGFTCMSIKRAI